MKASGADLRRSSHAKSPECVVSGMRTRTDKLAVLQDGERHGGNGWKLHRTKPEDSDGRDIFKNSTNIETRLIFVRFADCLVVS